MRLSAKAQSGGICPHFTHLRDALRSSPIILPSASALPAHSIAISKARALIFLWNSSISS